MKKIKFISLLSVVAALLLATSCKKPQPETPPTTNTPITPGSGVFVTNEGNFQGGNAKVSFYRFSDGTATEDLFQPANRRPLGDVCQGISFINGRAYVVVNNSGKIEVVNPSNCYASSTITGFISPRYILAVSPTKAYVSDLFAGKISIVNLVNNTVVGAIIMPGETETMLLYNNEVYVSSTDHDQLYVIDPSADHITDSISVAKGGNSMVMDANGKLWELCYGDYFTSAPGGLFRINPATHMVEQSWAFTTAEFPTKLCANSTGDTLYYLNYNVYRMPASSLTLPATPFIAATTQSFYGLAIRPQSGEVFVTDAVDYTQRGHLLRYSAAGVLLDDDVVGVIPGGIFFY